MPNLGISELIVIFMILLVVFGASRLPALGESLGRTVRNFKRGISQDDRIEAKSSTPAAKPADKSGTPSTSDATDAELVDKP